MNFSEEKRAKLDLLFLSQELLAQKKEQIRNKRILNYHDIQEIIEINKNLDRIEIYIFLMEKK